MSSGNYRSIIFKEKLSYIFVKGSALLLGFKFFLLLPLQTRIHLLRLNHINNITYTLHHTKPRILLHHLLWNSVRRRGKKCKRGRRALQWRRRHLNWRFLLFNLICKR